MERHTNPRAAALALMTLWAITGCGNTNMRRIPLDGSDALSWGVEAATAPDQTRLRILVVGDAGMRDDADDLRPHTNAVLVARAAQAACALPLPEHTGDAPASRCDLAIFVGDNVYPRGIREYRDRILFERFTALYTWAGPQYYTLGNHDWGTMISYDTDVAQAQLRLIAGMEGVHGGTHFYTFKAGQARLTAWDTTYITARCKDDPTCGDPSLPPHFDRHPPAAPNGATWTLAFGHHPYRSNGLHGDAGDYIDPFYSGEALQELMEQYIVGKVDLYMSGHDHDMQFHAHDQRVNAELGRTGLLVSGAGSKCRARDDVGPEEAAGERGVALYDDHGQLGFAIVDLWPERIAVTLAQVSATQRSWRVAFSASRGRTDAVWSHRDHAGEAQAIDAEGLPVKIETEGCE